MSSCTQWLFPIAVLLFENISLFDGVLTLCISNSSWVAEPPIVLFEPKSIKRSLFWLLTAARLCLQTLTNSPSLSKTGQEISADDCKSSVMMCLGLTAGQVTLLILHPDPQLSAPNFEAVTCHVSNERLLYRFCHSQWVPSLLRISPFPFG